MLVLCLYRLGLILHHAGEAEGEDHGGSTPACHGPRQRPHRCVCGGELSLIGTLQGFLQGCLGFVYITNSFCIVSYFNDAVYYLISFSS